MRAMGCTLALAAIFTAAPALTQEAPPSDQPPGAPFALPEPLITPSPRDPAEDALHRLTLLDDRIREDLRFVASGTRIRAGHTCVIPFRRTLPEGVGDAPLPEQVHSAAAPELTLRATDYDPEVIEVIAAPKVLAGEALGYLRIRALAPGVSPLSIGKAEMQIEVIPADAESSRPVIDGPATGAVVWGRLAVGVHFDDPGSAAVPRLIVDDGAGPTLEARWTTAAAQGPVRLAAFALDADALDEGVHTLTPTLQHPDGTQVSGDPVRIRIVRPHEGDLVEGEAEAPPPVERPEPFGENPPHSQRNPDASGGAFANNAGAYPPVCFPLEVEQAGWYQVMLRAGGTLAGGALPTVALLLDGSYEPRTNAPLLTPDWHRLALGVPVLLRPGDHVVTPFFGNDFYVERLADRNLYLDRIEILRVADAAGGREQGGVLGAPAMAGTNAGMQPMAGEDDAMMSGRMQMQDMMMMGDSAGAGARAFGVGPAKVALDSFDDLRALEQHPVRIAFARDLHQAEVAGELEIKGVCFWEGMRNSRPAQPPTVALEVNGWEISKQRSAAPTFWIDPARFTQRENTVRLIARLDDGTEAASPAQTVVAPWLEEDSLPLGFARPRAFHRFPIHDGGWDESVRRRLRDEHHPEERFSAAFYSNGVATLRLPDELEGAFDLHIEARGQHFDGPPVLHLSLQHADGGDELKPLDVPEWWGPHAAGRIELPPGEKELRFAFRNDSYMVGRGDRNLWLQSISLQESAPPDQGVEPAPAVVEIAYPADGHEAWMADAIVARAHEAAGGLAWAELVWDGEPSGLRVEMRRGVNPIVLHLPLRDVEPGEHTAAVRVAHLDGRITTSDAVRLNVLSQPPPKPGPFARAVHLLNRFAYGPASRELAAVLTRGESAWLRDQMATDADDPGLLNALAMGMIRFGDRRSGYDVPRRAIEQASASPAPARERLVFWAQNHFSTWIRKAEATRKWDEHLAFTRLGAAPFIDLLRTSATSPAMLRYLDQDRSFAGKINENYAREIMELHTLGVTGGYTQNDVTQLASILTGWMAADEGDGRSAGQGAIVHRFRFDPSLCDPTARAVLGYDFGSAAAERRHERAQEALEVLAAHPSTARYVCRKLAEHYVTATPDEALVESLAHTFMETGGDLGAVLVAMAENEAFWSELEAKDAGGHGGGGGGRLTKPLEHGLRFARTTNQPLTWAVGEYLDLSGMGLFDRPTPDGYPEEESAYSDSNAMLQRWRLARQSEWALNALVPGPWRWGDAELDEPAARRIADLIAIRLTGSALSEPSLKAATQIMLEGRGSRDERIRRGAVMVGQLPEASLK